MLTRELRRNHPVLQGYSLIIASGIRASVINLAFIVTVSLIVTPTRTRAQHSSSYNNPLLPAVIRGAFL